MDWRPHLSTDPNIMGGALCVKGTRIPVTVVLDNLAEGLSMDEMLAEYPTLNAETVQACVAFAAEMVHRTRGLVPA